MTLLEPQARPPRADDDPVRTKNCEYAAVLAELGWSVHEDAQATPDGALVMAWLCTPPRNA